MRGIKPKGFRKLIFASIILMFSITSVFAQIVDIVKLSQLSFSNQKAKFKDTVSFQYNSSSIDFAIQFYHHFLEKQDSEICVFSPSCADYWGELAERGLFVAWIVGFDRIARCSPLHTSSYPTGENGLLLDPSK